MDGVPDITQQQVAAGGLFVCHFAVPRQPGIGELVVQRCQLVIHRETPVCLRGRGRLPPVP
jgi:hypothetical protein